MDWNPNDTATLGLEWFPRSSGVLALDTNKKVVASSIVQTASVGIGSIQVPNAGIPTRGGLYAVEVYDDETGVPAGGISTLYGVPNEDVSIGNWRTQSGGSASLFATIDEGILFSVGDYITVTGFPSQYTGRFNTAALALTGKRILSVRPRVYAYIPASGKMNFGVNIGGANYDNVTNVGSIGGGGRWVGVAWTVNPATGKPWTIADVQAFDSTDEWYVVGATAAGVWAAVIVYAVVLEVVVMAENRLAIGTLDDRSSGLTVGTAASPAWNTATMTTPTGGAWTKDGSGRHLYVVRRLSNTGAMNVPWLDSGSAAPSGQSFDATLDSTYGFLSSMGDTPQTRLYPFIQRTTAPADHTDSQPYAALSTATVFSGRNAEGEFSGAAAANYAPVRFLVQYVAQTADLTVKIKRRSDNAQLGSTVSITAAAIAAMTDLGNGWRMVQVQVDPTPAGLATATQYYVEFSSTASSSAAWVLSLPSSNGAGQVATYNGTTDAATVNGAAENTSADIAVTIATLPTAPATMTATLGSQTVSETVNCVTSIPRADLSWTATSLGGAFQRYELQRSEDAGTTWTTIAWVTNEAVVAWKDYEAKRGIAVSYRIRVIRTDSAFSAWRTAGATVTKPRLAGTGAYAATLYFVSNADPTLNTAYEYRPVKDYAFAESDEQVRTPVYMRDYFLGANPLENRGVVVTWTLLVGVDDKVPAGGGASWTAFDPVRAIALAPTIPYVCTLDHRGNRLFAHMRVTGGNEDATSGGDLYVATVEAAQVDDTPTVVTVAA